MLPKTHSTGSNVPFGDNPSEEYILLITGGGQRLVYMLIIKGALLALGLISMFLEKKTK